MSTKKITKKELSAKAAELGLKGVAKLRKEELIHTIQITEGNTDCFTRIDNCAVSPCLYRAECQA
ncbi:MAG: Rho termination factor N-terminal domain-containing protein [Mariprofundus sp.]